jgi:hypothetical protein
MFIKELAPLAHEVLLACDLFDPLAVVCVRCRPERHLVEFPSQVHKRDREALPHLEFDREEGGYGCARSTVRVRVVALWARGDDGTHASFVCSDDEQQFERNRLQSKSLTLLRNP